MAKDRVHEPWATPMLKLLGHHFLHAILVTVLLSSFEIAGRSAQGQSAQDTLWSELDLAHQLREAGRLVEATEHAAKAHRLAESRAGRNNVTFDLAMTTTMLADLDYLLSGPKNPEKTRDRLKLAIVRLDKVRKAENTALVDPLLMETLQKLGMIFQLLKEPANAGEVLRRNLQISERVHGREHAQTGNAHYLLADNYIAEKKYSEAEPHITTAIVTIMTVGAVSTDSLAQCFSVSGWINDKLGKREEAKTAHQAAFSIRNLFKEDGTRDLAAQDAINLGSLYLEDRDYKSAANWLHIGVEIKLKANLPVSSSIIPTLRFVSESLEKQSDFSSAAQLREQLIRINPSSKSDSFMASAFLADEYRKVALLFEKAGDFERFYHFADRAFETFIKYLDQRPDLRKDLRRTPSAPIDNDTIFLTRIRSAWVLNESKGKVSPVFAEESFLVAQWMNDSSTSDALTLASARASAVTARGRSLIREWQDLREEKRKKLAEPDDKSKTQALLINDKMTRIASEIQQEVPDFFTLIYPRPRSLKEIQASLGEDDALVVFVLDVDQTFLWLVTKTTLKWERLSIGENTIAENVRAFRRGLDPKILGTQIDESGKSGTSPDLFNLDLAYEMYTKLLGPVASLVEGKLNLIVVPSIELTALPFHLLVTEKPARAIPEKLDGYREAAWLIKRHSVSVLPSIGSLNALSVGPSISPAAKPMIGFGDPVFGPENPPPRQCRDEVRTATKRGNDFWPGAGINRADLVLCRLIDTANEVTAVGASLGASKTDLKLRKDASEANVKQTALTDYRIVYFATHGLVAGDLSGGEPSLALSAPARITEFDDGLLTISEIARLQLNADWVVLSACNTIAGDKPGAEALSGLTRAFFYAGARAVLVSHWSIESESAAKLAINIFDRLKADPKKGPAQALRQAMLDSLSDTSVPRNAYPLLWAPFSLIGNGNRYPQRL
jgi:CHAT domain-containing protein/tetratricopeptide (TPR) repeat protein